MEEKIDNLDKYMLELVEVMSEDRQEVGSDKFWKMDITERGTPRKPNDQRSKNKIFT
jgi:hypothetical protein